MIINVGEGGGAGKAQSVKYDNSTSKLSADNVQGAIDELDVELEEVKTSFQDGCNTIVSGITAQGVTPKSNSPADIVTAVNTVATNKYNAGVTATKVGNASVAHVLSGKTFTNSSGVGLTGTMANKGAVTGSITTSGGTYTIPAGYHSGSGKVTGPTLAGLVGTNVTLASAGNLLSGVTAYGKNGTKYTDSMANKGAWTSTPTAPNKVTIPAGYHNGSGYVDASALRSNGTMSPTVLKSFKTNTAWTYTIQNDCYIQVISPVKSVNNYWGKITINNVEIEKYNSDTTSSSDWAGGYSKVYYCKKGNVVKSEVVNSGYQYNASLIQWN